MSDAGHEVLLADGGSAVLREVTRADAPRIAAFHRGLSLESIHFRYFSGLAVLPPLILKRFTEFDRARDRVLVAELRGEIIALASYHRSGVSSAAEVAFVVADAHQGRGIGTILLEELALQARLAGLASFVADTLPGNRAMLRVFADAGFALERSADGSVVHLRFPIEETPRARGAREAREHQAEARSIARLLAPRALVVAGEWAREPEIAALRARGFRGGVFAERDAPAGAVDLGLYAGPAAALGLFVARCAELGAHGLVVGALDGAPAADAERGAFERELGVAARRNGLRLLGPESAGFANPAAGVALCTVAVSRTPRSGGLALACESAADAAALLEQAARRGAGVSSLVCLGRRADVSLNDLLQYWQDDAATRAVALSISSAGNPDKFTRIAARLRERKPIAALAPSSPELYALYARAGIERAASLEALVERGAELAAMRQPA